MAFANPQSPSCESMPIQFLSALDEMRNSISKLTLGQTTLTENITILSQENEKRLHEGQEILKRIGIQGAILTDREQINETNMTEDVDAEEEESVQRIRHMNEMIMRNRQATVAQESPVRRIEGIQAKDAIRAIKSINGQDDMGIEDFIRTILRIKNQCSQPQLLLDFILAENITGNAEKAIRYTTINTYNDLFEALRQNLKQTGSVLSIKSRMESCEQGPTESVQTFFLRFKQISNEFNYAVQLSSDESERRIALKLEEKKAINRYMLNLRRENGTQVRSMKPISLFEAQKEAAGYETWLKESQPLKTTITPPRPAVRFTPRPSTHARPQANTQGAKALNQNLSLADKSKITCLKCGKIGYFASQCFVKTQNFQQGQFQTRPPQPVKNIQEEQPQLEEKQDYYEMSQEEINERIHYEESAELKMLVSDYSPSNGQDLKPEDTNY